MDKDHTSIQVTIGMPVYNGEKTIAMAIESMLAQTFGHFRLLISDNASTDATSKICTAFAESDSRVSYVRQPVNLGAEGNFDYLLSRADSEYFMWAAADDTRSPDFIATNLAFLEAHPDYVGSTCRVRFVGGDYDPVAMGDETRAENSAGERILRFFDVWHANGRFYSLMRTRELREAKCGVKPFLGNDWVVVIRLLAQAKLNRVDHGSVDLGRGGLSNSSEIFSSYRTTASQWVFPMLDLQKATWASVRDQALLLRVQIALRLIKLGLLAAATQMLHEFKRAR